MRAWAFPATLGGAGMGMVRGRQASEASSGKPRHTNCLTTIAPRTPASSKQFPKIQISHVQDPTLSTTPASPPPGPMSTAPAAAHQQINELINQQINKAINQ